ncbi:hypothetical protein Tsubulata_039312 [Turnera subulata]|uniref:Uncharacterized protein n=1 Tax=Turnera subulata TaxID=218843 RepID=A0A9Q0F4K8_9ROSI|nr:hypothetical protein Tsubulata_039312 [Turnera subulata]
MLPYYVERKENPFVRDGTIDIFADMSAAEIEEELVSHDFVGFPDFGYLLSMSCGYSFRPEALEKLKAELHRLEDKQKTLGTTTPEKIM